MRALLILGLLLAGCDGRSKSMMAAAAVPGPPAPQYPPNLRRQVVDGVVMKCAHVILNKDQICGVMTLENAGKAPVALVNRGNSWGSFQYRLTVGKQTAANPQISWRGNVYHETALGPGEKRHAWFTVTWQHARPDIRKGAWRFDVRTHMTVDQNFNEMSTFQPFEAGQPLIFLMQAIPPLTPASAGELPMPLWTGIATAISSEMASLADLESLAIGGPLY